MRTDTAACPDPTAGPVAVTICVTICGTQLGSGIQPGPSHHDLGTHVGLSTHHSSALTGPHHE